MSGSPEGGGPELAERLTAVMSRALGEAAPEVLDLHRLSGGSSRETWSFDVRSGDTRRPLILQREMSTMTEIFGIGAAAEADVLRVAGAVGVPVPGVVASDPGTDAMGTPFLVTERVAGETIPQRILRDERYTAARRGLAAQYGAALARVQQVRPEALPALADEDPVVRYRQALEDLGHPHPAFELGFRWLEQHRPGTAGPVLVHGDYRNGNGVVGEEGLRAVIDWELAHLGDPREDLAWMCLRAWRFGRPDPVGGFGAYRDLVGAYRDAGGVDVGPEELRWWMVLGTIRWGLICVIRTVQHLSGVARSVELATIGRRACEAEYDLLLLLP